MALSYRTCKAAIGIFCQLTEIKTERKVVLRNEANQYNTNCILGIGRKADGGWESVFINVKTPTPEQFEMWDAKKKQIHNSASMREVQPGITRFGFY